MTATVLPFPSTRIFRTPRIVASWEPKVGWSCMCGSDVARVLQIGPAGVRVRIVSAVSTYETWVPVDQLRPIRNDHPRVEAAYRAIDELMRPCDTE